MTKVTHRELEQLSALFKRYGDKKEKPWFLYAVSMNNTKIQPYLDALKSARALTPMEDAYQQERTKLLEAHAEKDERGISKKIPVTLPGGMQGHQYDIKDRLAFEKAEQDLLKDKFPTLEQEALKKQKELEKLLDSEVDIEFKEIRMSEVPEDTISGNDMSLLISKEILNFDLEREEDTPKSK